MIFSETHNLPISQQRKQSAKLSSFAFPCATRAEGRKGAHSMRSQQVATLPNDSPAGGCLRTSIIPNLVRGFGILSALSPNRLRGRGGCRGARPGGGK